MRPFILYAFLIFFTTNKCLFAQSNNIKDTIEKMLLIPNDKPLDYKTNELNKACELIETIGNDSIKNELLKKAVRISFKQKTWRAFKTIKDKHIIIAQKEKDSFGLAKTLEITGFYFQKIHVPDSTFYYYYKSYKLYKAINDSINLGKLLLNTAIVQKNVHDYTGSINSAFEGLRYLKNSDNYRRVSSLYNNLGIVYNELEDWENALKYHTKAYEFRQKLENPIYQIHSLNNIGMVYKNSHDYAKAQIYYTRGLKTDSLHAENKMLYSMLIDNLAHARLKSNDSINCMAQFTKALRLREQIKDSSGMVINYIHLAEYYKEAGNNLETEKYASKAEKMAKSIHLYRDYLTSLKLLSDVVDGETGKRLLDKYILSKDSLDKISRKHKKQFERIKFEVEEKNERIKDETQSNQNKLYLIIGLIFLIVAVVMSNLFSRQKRKKENLEFKTIIDKLHESQHKFFHTENPILNQSNKLAFITKLKEKYNITDSLIEFWQYQTQGLSEAQIAEKLKSVTKEAIRKRRNKLYKKLKEYYGHIDDLDKFLSVSIYREDFIEFEKSNQKRSENSSTNA